MGILEMILQWISIETRCEGMKWVRVPQGWNQCPTVMNTVLNLLVL
jgi:hypothetical protein